MVGQIMQVTWAVVVLVYILIHTRNGNGQTNGIANALSRFCDIICLLVCLLTILAMCAFRVCDYTPDSPVRSLRINCTVAEDLLEACTLT